MDLTLQLKYGARHQFRDRPFVEQRSSRMLRQEREPAALHRARQSDWLRHTLERAAAVIPAYAGLSGRIPRDGLHEFVRTLPLVDKALLRAERERFYPNGGRARAWWLTGKTSGTTGTPLEVFRSYDSALWEQAFHIQHWRWAGLAPRGRQVVLRGDLVVPVERRTPPFWLHDRIGHQLFVSTRHLDRNTLPDIAEAIRDFGATQLRAYPSAAAELARLAEEVGVPIRFDAVITGSEVLYPLQRDLVSRAFGARVFDFYGMAERVAFAAECEHGRMHVHPGYSLVEIVDEHGAPTDGEGSVVGTTFHNLAMPLLRYRLNDSARWGREPCPCGRTHPTIEALSGKVEERVFDLDGQAVSPSVITFAFKGVAHIERAQVAQVARDQWLLRIVPGAGFGEAEAEALLANFRKLVSNRLNVRIERVAAIPNLPSGKFKWVSQESAPAERP